MTSRKIKDNNVLHDFHTGYEPRRLFNVVEFLMNDKDANGTVSVEEAMQILFLRSGRGLLDSVLFLLGPSHLFQFTISIFSAT